MPERLPESGPESDLESDLTGSELELSEEIPAEAEHVQHGRKAMRGVRGAIAGVLIGLVADQAAEAQLRPRASAKPPASSPSVATAPEHQGWPDAPKWITNFHVTPQQVAEADAVLTHALASHRVLAHAPDAALARDHYFALITKESHFDPNPALHSDVRGLMQVRDIARRAVNQSYHLQGREIFQKADMRSAKANVECGILYHQLLLKKAKQLFPQELDAHGQLKLADILYNAGEGTVGKLMLDGDTYASFTQRVGKELAQSLHGKGPSEVLDPEYGVMYHAAAGVPEYVELWKDHARHPNHAGPAPIKGVRVLKVGELLRYPAVIEALQSDQLARKAQLHAFMKGALMPANATVAAAQHLPSTPTPPAAHLPVSVKHIAPDPGAHIEHITRQRSLYQIVEEQRVRYIGKIPGYTKSSFEEYSERESARGEIEIALIRYNQDLSPAFKALNIDEEFSNIPMNTVLVIPTAKTLAPYILNIRAEGEEQEATVEKAAQVAHATQLYIDPSMDRLGQEYFSAHPRPFMIDAPAYGRLHQGPRKQTRMLILHSTASPIPVSVASALNDLRISHKAHFLVGLDGQIYFIVPEMLNIDHAGRLSNTGKYEDLKASWDGVGDISGQAIGIEVQATAQYEWNDAQYAAVRKLVEYLGGKYHIRKSNVLAHYQVSVSKVLARGRKSDPFRLRFEKLGLPNNDHLLDWDVVRGQISSNLPWIRKDKNWVIRKGPKTEMRDDTLDGLIASDAMAKEWRKTHKVIPLQVPHHHGKKSHQKPKANGQHHSPMKHARRLKKHRR